MSLRILHVLSSPHLGGAEQVCLHLAQAQLAAGHEVALHVLTLGRVAEAARAAGIPTFCSDTGQEKSRLPRRVRWEAATAELSATTRQFGPDLVHSHVPLTNLMCHRALAKLSVPWVATIHGSWRQFGYAPQTQDRPYLKPYLWLRHAVGVFWTARSAARLVAVSESVRRDLERVGVASGRIVRIHNGLPNSDTLVSAEAGRKRLNIPMDAFVVGSLGFFAPVKGFDLLIRAFALLAPRYPQLLLAIAGGDVLGQDSVRRSLHSLAERLGVSGRVHFLGLTDGRRGFLSALDVYVVSSRTEGLPLSLLEAMKHGKASVVSSAGGCTEAARPELEGLVFKSGSIRNLAQAIERLIGDRELRESLGHAAQARLQDYFTLRRCAEEYEQLYHAVLAPQGSVAKCVPSHG
jgi:glycosyltransferase involved in cell wall biosynthesis